MKGIVFCLFNELVEEKFGLEMWETLLEKVQPESQGIYTSAANYPFTELVALVGELSAQSGLPANDLVTAFGEYMFPKFAERNPEFVSDIDNLKDFLKTVDQVIHVEVKKMYPSANLPSFDYEDDASDQLTMRYQSPRKLCHLSEGLIQGAAKHYGESIHVDHPVCMHNGAEHCDIIINFIGSD